jgi:NitT/TauT family transport system permease protein
MASDVQASQLSGSKRPSKLWQVLTRVVSWLLPFRKEISVPSKVAVGAFSVILLIGSYTALAEYWRVHHPKSKAFPTWKVLVTDGVARAFTAKHGGGKVDWQSIASGEQGYDAWIWVDVKATFSRLFMGILAGVLLSVVVGLLMGCYTTLEAFFLPPLSFLAKIPPTAMLAVYFVLFSTGFEMYVAMIGLSVFFTLAQAIYHSAKEDVPEELIFKSYTLGATQIKCIWDVIYRHVLPKILEFVRLSIAPAMVCLIAAEWFVGDMGFGYRLKIQSRLLDMSLVYVYLIFLGTAGFLIDMAFIRFQRWVCPWYEQ